MADPHHTYNWLGIFEKNGKDLTDTVKKQAVKKGALFCDQSVINVDFKNRGHLRSLSQAARKYMHSLSSLQLELSRKDFIYQVKMNTGIEVLSHQHLKKKPSGRGCMLSLLEVAMMQ